MPVHGIHNMCVNEYPEPLVLRAQYRSRGRRACRPLGLGWSGTCAWYSTECALVSSQRCPSSERTMNPEDVDVNCRLRCQGREKLGFECTHSTLTTAFMKVSCKHMSAYSSGSACAHLSIARVPSDAPFIIMRDGKATSVAAPPRCASHPCLLHKYVTYLEVLG